MQVGAVSLSNKVNFKASDEEYIFASLNDKALRHVAYNQACEQVNDKRHKKINNALYYSLPIVGGLSTLASKVALKQEGNLAVLAPATKIRGIKLMRAGAITGVWTAALASIALVAGAENLLYKKSQSVKDFVNEHPIISTVGTLVTAFGAIYGVNKVGGKLLGKLGNYIEKNISKVNKFDNALNNSKILNSAENLISKLPTSIKSLGATALKWSPVAVMATQIAHYFGHEKVKNNQAYQNYSQLKDAQEIIREDIANEVAENIVNGLTQEQAEETEQQDA